MLNKLFRFLYFILSLAIIFLGCAKTGFPPGGPIDKLPPLVISTQPMAGATHVPLDTKIEIRFSEAVQHASVEGALFISPNPGLNLKLKWRGKRLQIQFPDGLRTDRTYVVTIGTNSKDMRNNAMKESFVLAFSTGSELDKGEITGNVYGEGPVAGTQVWAYDLAETSNPNPHVVEPFYITQASASGDYKFSNVALSRYRLFAIIDRDLNQRYDPEYDALGVMAKEAQLADDHLRVDHMNCRIAVRDTTRPVLVSASASDRHHVDLRFSESIAADDTLDNTHIFIYHDKDTLSILQAYLDERSPAFVHLLTSEQDSVEYTVGIRRLHDLVGYAVDSSAQQVFLKGVSQPDTSRPRVISFSPADSSHDIGQNPTIEIIFNEPMNKSSVESFLSVSDSIGQKVSGSFEWLNGTHPIFKPDSLLKSLMTYSITMMVDSVHDFFGNTVSDSSFQKIFTTINKDTLSEISGLLADEDSLASGTFFLTARSVDRKGSFYETQLPMAGRYVFPDILPGGYVIEIFRDQDNNDKFSLGEAFPFIPAERFYVYPDTIKVRSRWPNEGNDIVFPR